MFKYRILPKDNDRLLIIRSSTTLSLYFTINLLKHGHTHLVILL